MRCAIPFRVLKAQIIIMRFQTGEEMKRMLRTIKADLPILANPHRNHGHKFSLVRYKLLIGNTAGILQTISMESIIIPKGILLYTESFLRKWPHGFILVSCIRVNNATKLFPFLYIDEHCVVWNSLQESFALHIGQKKLSP